MPQNIAGLPESVVIDTGVCHLVIKNHRVQRTFPYTTPPSLLNLLMSKYIKKPDWMELVTNMQKQGITHAAVVATCVVEITREQDILAEFIYTIYEKPAPVNYTFIHTETAAKIRAKIAAEIRGTQSIEEFATVFIKTGRCIIQIKKEIKEYVQDIIQKQYDTRYPHTRTATLQRNGLVTG